MKLSTLLKMHNRNANHKFDTSIFVQMTQEKPTRGKPVESVFIIAFEAHRKDTFTT
jgi:hypothetical protein